MNKVKGDTKLVIRETAKKMFNEHGYNTVSMRDIAGALDISVGNLTYHYNKKEDLIEAIVLDIHKNYVPNKPIENLKDLNKYFHKTLEGFKQNAFYFWHYTQLSEISDNIKNIQLVILKEQDLYLREAFDTLNKKGYIKDEEFFNQYPNLVRALLNQCIFWVPQNKILGLDLDISSFEEYIWSLIYPLFTDETKILYNDNITNRSNKRKEELTKPKEKNEYI